MLNRKLNVILNGGLGNQLFIYCAAKTFAELNNINKVIYYSNADILNNVKSLNDYIDGFNIISPKKNKIFNKIYIYLKCKFLKKVINDKSKIGKYDNYKNFTIDGYFQEPKWYKHSLKIVLGEFFTNKFSNSLNKQAFYDVVISFRRTDYKEYGWCINLNYYFKALRQLKVSKKEKIKVISDDDKFSRYFENLLVKKGYSVYKNSKKRSQKLDIKKKNKIKSKSKDNFLALIKSKKLIMSNSSFSWWAAVFRHKLNLKDNKVVCPKKWFPNDKKITKFDISKHPGKPLNWKYVNNDFEN